MKSFAPCLILAAVLMTGAAEAASPPSEQSLPPCVQLLTAVGHLIEDGRACGLISIEEADSLYRAGALDAAVTYSVAPERVALILRIARDHARDVPVTRTICEAATSDVPVLRETLAPWSRR